jgi:hypothetical protein
MRKCNFIFRKDLVMKTEKLVLGGWLLGAAVLVMGTWAEAGTVRVNSFADSRLGDFTGDIRNLEMALEDNLLARIGGVDKVLGLDVASGEVYGEGYWHLGLTGGPEGLVVGWATNSDKGWPGYGGYLAGKYSGSADYGLSDGEKPLHAFLVYDSTGNGWDVLDGQIGSVQDLADGDLFFTEEDILFGPDKISGAVSLLPSYPSFGTAILPSMTVMVIPEPATLIMLGIGGLLLRKYNS